jgi:acetoin utilization protein AcuB
MTQKHMPHMLAVMVPFPYSIEATATLMQAEAMMQEHNIRHLPVVDSDDIVGVISDRDLQKAVSIGHKLQDEADLMVGDLVTHRPYMVDISDPVASVVSAMADKRLGSVIVLKEGDIAGIFTAVDALEHYSELLHTLYDPTDGGDEAA